VPGDQQKSAKAFDFDAAGTENSRMIEQESDFAIVFTTRIEQ